jgi:hypothetical protein
VTAVAPGKLDLFVLTLVDGKRAAIDPIMDYDAALARARAFHRDHPCQIKVLPVTGTELFNMLGITRPQRPQPMDADLYRLMVDRLKEVVRDSADPDARADALALLTTMGVVTG